MSFSGALVIIAILAVLAYMYFFNDLKFKSNIHHNTETTIMHQAETDDPAPAPAPAASGN